MTCVICSTQLTPSQTTLQLAGMGDGALVILGRHALTIFCCSDGDLWETCLAYCLGPGTKLHLLSTHFEQRVVQNQGSL